MWLFMAAAYDKRRQLKRTNTVLHDPSAKRAMNADRKDCYLLVAASNTQLIAKLGKIVQIDLKRAKIRPPVLAIALTA